MKITTKQYIDNQGKWIQKLFNAEIKSVREAVDKVEKTNTAKFEGQNEWRSQYKDQTANFVTRRELWIALVFVVGILATILLKK